MGEGKRKTTVDRVWDLAFVAFAGFSLHWFRVSMCMPAALAVLIVGLGALAAGAFLWLLVMDSNLLSRLVCVASLCLVFVMVAPAFGVDPFALLLWFGVSF